MMAAKHWSALLMVVQAFSVINALQDKKQGVDKVFVCYFGSWAVYRPGAGKYDVENINATMCTHIMYGFAGLGDNVIKSLDPWNDLPVDYGKGAYVRFTKLKEQNPSLKTILAIGGWNEGSSKYSSMASSAASRKTFIDSVVPFLQKYGFDGLDMDWEYPTQRGGAQQDKQNHALLLKELKEEFSKHGLMLTIAVSAGVPTIDAAYDVPQISQYVDLINVMTYDFHGGSFDQVTGINSPLYPRPQDQGTDRQFTIDVAVKHWIELGAPKDKLVLGLPLYGRTFNLQSADKHDLYDPSNGPGPAGPYTRESGFLGYNEICVMLKEGGWSSVLNEYYKAPYIYKDRQWISYDDIESLAVKTQYLLDMGLKGAMVWSVETDDFQNTCGGGVNPLLNTIRKTLGLGPAPIPVLKTASSSITSEQPGSTTSSPYVIAGPATEKCPEGGYVRDAKDCSVYYECAPGSSKEKFVQFKCAKPTVFNMKLHICDWPIDVDDCYQS